MAESVVSFVAQRLRDLLIDEAKFLYEVTSQVEEIQVEFRRMQCFLRDADARQGEDQIVQNCVSEIREVAYDVEDVLETYAIQVLLRRDKGLVARYFGMFKEGVNLHQVGSEICLIKTKITSLTRSLQTYGIKQTNQGESSSYMHHRRQILRRTYSHLVEEDLVGLEEDVDLLVARLLTGDDRKHYQTVSICGMGGLGKTTLARKVYHHSEIRSHFHGFAWACISQQWQMKDVLQGILNKLEPEKRKLFASMKDEELVKELYVIQQRKKCFVVLDDIWSMDFWDSLGPAFPRGEHGSKILLTTRRQDIALHVDPTCFVHQPRFLDEDESWELVQRKLLHRLNDSDFKLDMDMERLGREMVGQCGGLPLAINVLGGLLATKPTLQEWKTVHKNIDSYLQRGHSLGKHGKVYEVLAVSYSDLSYQLKPCFLCLGNFPEDSEIRARKLYQIWAAEGFLELHRSGEEESILEIGEHYLSELAQRSMVRIQVDEFSGKIKSCQLHDLMRDMCLSKGKEENFPKIIPCKNENEPMNSISLATTGLTRRLSINADLPNENYLPLKHENAESIRSALFFTSGRWNVHIDNALQSLFKNFKLLKILQLEDFNLEMNLCEAIGNLVHLRYLSLRNSKVSEFPSTISKLKFLQTLDIQWNYLVHDMIPDCIWKLEQLRHLYLPRRRNISYLRLGSLRNLEVVKHFSSNVSDVRDLLQLTNLRKIDASLWLTWENLEEVVSYLTSDSNRLNDSSFRIFYSFDCEKELHFLREFVGCHHLRSLVLTGHISKLPEQKYFSLSLMKLTLTGSRLKEDPMATLEKLPRLKYLSLDSDAFVGKEIHCSYQGFPQLRTLEFRSMWDLEDWRVDEGSMPNLLHLTINGCQNLNMIPDGLRFVTSIQKLHILNMPMDFLHKLQSSDGEPGEDFFRISHISSLVFWDFIGRRSRTLGRAGVH